MSRTTVLVTVLAALLAGAATAHGATIPVTTTSDVVADDGLCSLREAVFAARFDQPLQGCSAGSGADVIQLGPGTFSLEPGPAGATEDGNESGDLDTGPAGVLRIAGAGPGATVIDALGGDRALDVFPGVSVTLDGLTIRRGRSASGAAGGAVRNQGALNVVRAVFEDNATGDGAEALEAGGAGAAIWSGGPASPSLTVADSLFRANVTGVGSRGGSFGPVYAAAGNGGPGGAVAVEAGSAELTAVTFAGNRTGRGGSGFTDAGSRAGAGAGGDGGAIFARDGLVTVVNGTFAGNATGVGGMNDPFGDVRPPGQGGAVALAAGAGVLRVTWSTFAGNIVGAGGQGGNAVSAAQVSASVLAEPGGACATAAPAALANLVLPGDASCPGPRIEGDPRLGALGDNGGPVPTMAPGPGSLAIDLLVGVPCPATDARGLVRPRFAGCDAGAVEVQPGSPGAPAAGAAPPPAAGAAARGLRALRVAPAAFRAGRKGALVTYRLAAAGRVVLSVRATKPGKRLGRRCVAPTRRLRAARACTRAVTLRGRIARQGRAGLNKLRFTGRIGGRLLAPGRYTLVVTLPASAGLRPVSTAKGFRILR